jgi:hypothetical protein
MSTLGKCAGALAGMFLLACPVVSAGQRPDGDSSLAPIERIDWPELLARARLPLPGLFEHWHQQAFTGNGREGMLGGFSVDGRLEVRIGRSDVVDHRASGDQSQFRPAFDAARLPVGRFIVRSREKLKPGAKAVAGIDLWHAEASGSVVTEAGPLRWRFWTPMGAEVNVIEIETGEPLEVVFEPDPAVGTRTKNAPRDYQAHPAATRERDGDAELCVQRFPAGGGYTVAWQTNSNASGMVVVTAIGYSRDGDGHRAEAVAALRRAGDIERLRDAHRAFWSSWWPRGGVLVPDRQTQAFYWLQLYKLGSAVRADGPLMDLMGPWWGGGPWPAIWWNLNVQLAYQPCAPANRPELLDSLVGMIETNADRMGQCVPAKWGGPHAIAVGRVSSYDGRSLIEDSGEAGNLTWALAVAWDGYRLTASRRRAERLLPLMARAVAFHVARAKLENDGRFHLPRSLSPESGVAADCLYELGPMRWLLRTLVDVEAELGWKHPDQPRWRDVLDKLAEFPADEHGWLKGASAPVALGHRHWSHLVHVYPLRDFDPADTREMELVSRSVAHWTSNRGEWRGYSGLGASSMFSLLGDTERARPPVVSLANGNTLYREAGPCLETPLFALATIQDSLLTWDRRGLRVFAGTPSDWKSAAFFRLRAPLGLTVSARREGGVTAWIHIKAEAAQTVRLEPRFAGLPRARATCPVALRDLKHGWYELDLAAGQEVLLTAANWTKPIHLETALPP